MEIITKANIGDEIFFLADNKVKTSTVRYIEIKITEDATQFGYKETITTVYYTSHSNKLYQNEIFPTKQALLDSL